jgi:serine/threonine protein kinase
LNFHTFFGYKDVLVHVEVLEYVEQYNHDLHFNHLRIVRDLASGLNTLHEAGFVHQDLVGQSGVNVIITPDWKVKIIDFGATVKANTTKIGKRFGPYEMDIIGLANATRILFDLETLPEDVAEVVGVLMLGAKQKDALLRLSQATRVGMRRGSMPYSLKGGKNNKKLLAAFPVAVALLATALSLCE